MMNKLSHQEKWACARSNFCSYVGNPDGFSPNEKEYLVKAIIDNNLSGILYVSSVLAVWSFVAEVIQ